MLCKLGLVVALASSLSVAGPIQYIQHYLGVDVTSHKHHHEKNLTLSYVRHELKHAEIIPTVIDDFKPSFLLNVTWPSRHYTSTCHKSKQKHHHNHTAMLGNKLHPHDLQHAPLVSLYSPTNSSSCTHSLSSTPLNNLVITLTDPDAPSRKNPKYSEICHWIGVGLPVSIDDSAALAQKSNYSNGITDLVPYMGPAPPRKSGDHRYVFLAFAPLNGTSEPLHLSKPEGRRRWGMEKGRRGDGTVGVRQWAAEHGLVPIAANFVYAEYKKH